MATSGPAINDAAEAKQSDDENLNGKAPVNPVNMNQVVNKWNAMARFYANGYNQFMSPTTYSLIPHLKLNQSTDKTFKILDVALGDGFNSVRIIRDLYTFHCDASFEYHGIDISSEMINIARENIKNDKLLSSALKDNDDRYKVSLAVGNAEDLSTFTDHTFDRYLASLCLMITPNPLSAVKEAYRTLKPNGICAFSVWGFEDKSNYFSTFKPIFSAIDTELGNVSNDAPPPSNFYLVDDLQSTLSMFKSVGFKTVYYWDVNVACPWSAKEWCEYLLESPPIVGLLKKCENDEQQKKVRNIVTQMLNERWNEFVRKKNEAITHNNVCIVAMK